MNEPHNECIIAFAPERCNQCTGCQTACKAWRGLAYGINNRRVVNIWKVEDYPKVKNSSLSLACLHCVDPACAEICPEEAIVKRTDNGLVEVISDLCIGCRACFDACPYSVPQFGEDDLMTKCDLCSNQFLVEILPPCVATCPGDALKVITLSSSEKLIYEEQTLKLLKGENSDDNN